MKSDRDEHAGWGFENPFKAFNTAGPLFGSGIQLAAVVVLMFFLGRWLDTHFETTPWLMIVCIIFGIAGGLFHFIKTVSNLEQKEKREDQR
jgi:ATP synthase protein I